MTSMKTVGLIGGLSPESTVVYYRGLNEAVNARLGGHHNAQIILNSVDFGAFVALKEQGDWDTQGQILCQAASSLEKAGADFIVLATNTMHKFADDIEVAVSIPFLHMADATAHAIKAAGLTKVALLGTAYTMEQDFYKARLAAHGLDAIVPDDDGRAEVHRIIYDELCKGIVKDKSRRIYQDIVAELQKKGAQGVILGCTEITMLIGADDVEIPVFDTTQIHIKAAAEQIF